jgi:hypothetical protein
LLQLGGGVEKDDLLFGAVATVPELSLVMV